jgi:O-acetyl-ADP-ribose deacetylase (regulator of RNase III)
VIELVIGDLTKQEVDVIVNAANSSLLGGGGVDGAIHRAGGPSILDECRRLGGCEPGDAKATSGGELPAHWVIHAVGPIWGGGQEGEGELLASCHIRAIEIADGLGCTSIAFPAISTGAYGYPVELAAPVAIGATAQALQEHPSVTRALFVFRDERTLAPYRNELKAGGP